MVHNPGSGDDDHARHELAELVRRAGHQVVDHSSDSDWQAAIATRPDLIVAAGGDGTVAEVAKAIAGRGIPLTILPTGTANNIASWLGLGAIPHEALIAGWQGGSLQPFDLGIARGPWPTHQFLESVGVGLLAQAMAEIDGGPAGYVNELDGRGARVSAALDVVARVLREMRPIRCDLEIDAVKLSGEYVLVEVLNFGMAGPNLRLAPHADGADGVLDVVLVEARERDRIEAHLSRMRADPASPAKLPARGARRVNLECEACTVHLDDTLWPGDGGVAPVSAELTMQPAAVTFLIPRPEAGREASSRSSAAEAGTPAELVIRRAEA